MMTFRDFTQFFLTLHLNKKVPLNIELVVFFWHFVSKICCIDISEESIKMI